MILTTPSITIEQVKLFIREGEGLTVEFKERYTPRIDEDRRLNDKLEKGTRGTGRSMRLSLARLVGL